MPSPRTIDQTVASERRTGRLLLGGLALIWLAAVASRVFLASSGPPLDVWLEVAIDLGVLTAVLGAGVASATVVRQRRMRRLLALPEVLEQLKQGRAERPRGHRRGRLRAQPGRRRCLGP